MDGGNLFAPDGGESLRDRVEREPILVSDSLSGAMRGREEGVPSF